MKKEKLLSLALLLTLAGPYIASSVNLAHADDTAQSEASQPSSTQSSSEGDDHQSQVDNDHNGIPDHQEDKNHNGVPDDEEDANKNGIPDDMDAKEEASSASSESSSSQEAESSQSQSAPSSSSQNSSTSSTTESSSSSTDDKSKTESSSQPSSSTDKDKSKTDTSADKQKDKDKDTSKQAEQAPKQSKTQAVNQQIQKSLAPLSWSTQQLLQAQQSQSSNNASTPWFSDVDDIPATAPTYTAYVEHWSGTSAYDSNLLAHRYGITAEQLDGYLNSLGVAYDHNRLNGKLLLQWQKDSGLDVRAIIAIAMAESSLGTAGVATMQGSNMFGYGAFDSNPDNAANFSDSKAIKLMTSETIIKNKNWTFKIQDDKAKKNAMGQLNPVTDGGVYFTDTSGTGKRRAKIMQDVDTWIDQHGGTPPIPEELKHLGGTSTQIVPTGYQISQPMSLDTYVAASYPWGQCTWFVYNRAKELGYNYGAYMGNGGDWQYQAGYETTHTPKVGYAVSFAPGQAGADSSYGHVAIVEEVKKDGSILISESNALGMGVVSYRTFTAQQAATLTYVVGQK